jgi:hypothetical protein
MYLYYIHLFAFYTPKPALWIKKPVVSSKTFFKALHIHILFLPLYGRHNTS